MELERQENVLVIGHQVRGSIFVAFYAKRWFDAQAILRCL